MSYEETRRAVVDVLWGDKHPSRVEGSDVTISLGGAIMNSDRADYLTLQLVRGYQAAFDRLADAVGQVQPVAPEDLKQAVRTAMAETVQVEVSVRDADA